MPSPDTKKRVSRRAERLARRPVAIDPHQLYGVDETAAARDQSRAGLYNDIADGLITPVYEGGRTKFTGAEIIRRNREVAGDVA